MTSAEDLVVGRKLQVPVDELETSFMVQIQRILDEGDHDSTDRMLWTQAVLALRELSDLRRRFNAPDYLKWRRDLFVGRIRP